MHVSTRNVALSTWRSASEEQEVVLARRLEPGEPHSERDLRPVSRLVQQDVEQHLARADGPLPIQDLERSDLVGDVLVEILRELTELAADRGAIIEQRRRISAGQPRLFGQRLSGEALKVPALGEEDVIDQFADCRKPRPRLYRRVDRGGMQDEPGAPLLPLGVRVAQELVERHGQ